MKRRKSLLPSPATVIALVALFVALGGTALALTKNSVGSKQLKPGAVKTQDLAKNAVTSQKVKDESLRAGDFAAGQLPVGAQGPQGPVGPEGAAGSARAYAVVFDSCPGGVCTPAKAKNISQVRRIQAGVYCVRATGISQLDVGALVSYVAPTNNIFTTNAFVQYSPQVPFTGVGQTPYCSDANDFTILVRTNGSLSNDGGFMILVP